MAPKKDNSLEKKLETMQEEWLRETERNRSAWQSGLESGLEQVQGRIESRIEARFQGLEETLRNLFKPADQHPTLGQASSSMGKETPREKPPEVQTESRKGKEILMENPPETVTAASNQREIPAIMGVEEWRPGRKLEFPTFGGGDPDPWIHRVERYFSLNPMSEDEKLEHVMVGLEDHALAWYQYMYERWRYCNWEEVKMAVLDRFALERDGSIFRRLASVKQETDVEDYITRFELLLGQLRGMVTDDMVDACFVNGLSPRLQA